VSDITGKKADSDFMERGLFYMRENIEQTQRAFFFLNLFTLRGSVKIMKNRVVRISLFFLLLFRPFSQNFSLPSYPLPTHLLWEP